MRPFEHVNAGSVDDVLAAIGADWQTRLIAGGTDLLSLMKRSIIAPSRLVNMKTATGLNYLDFDESQGLRIGAQVTLSELASHPAVRRYYRALEEAIDSAASPQLRNMATLAGNLCQTSRCWYYRGDFVCWLKGGSECYAENGENHLHALFGGGPCYSAHPSDPAPALIALGAELSLRSRGGGLSTVPVEGLFSLPSQDRRREIILEPGQLITEVRLPPPRDGARGCYFKAMPRETWAFALASVAVHGIWEGPVAREISIMLGSVAPIPWRSRQAENLVRGQAMDANLARQAGEAAVADAKPLAHNGYKLPLVLTLVQRALLTTALGEKLPTDS